MFKSFKMFESFEPLNPQPESPIPSLPLVEDPVIEAGAGEGHDEGEQRDSG
jgi:hypothetical protein